MSHVYLKPKPRRKRRRTAAQVQARFDYGAPLPLQPRRPLRRLAGHPVWDGRVPVVTPAALRADPWLHWAYVLWGIEQINRWMEDDSVSLLAISGTWIADLRK